MTTHDRFDDVVAQWLLDSGPADVRPAALDAALELAARKPQHRGFRTIVSGVGQPSSRPRIAVALGLVAIVLAGMLFAIGGPWQRPVLPTAVPSAPPPTDHASPSPDVSSSLGGGGWITVAAAGRELHILTPDGATSRAFSRGYFSCPRLSPDGTEVGYGIRFQGFHVTRLTDDVHRTVASSEEVNNFGYKEGVWSPDRSHLAFLVNEGDSQVMKVLPVFADLPATRTLFSTATDDLIAEAAWSADGSSVVVGHLGRLGLSIDVVGLDGVVRQTVGPLLGAQGMLAWSPDGALVASLGEELRIIDLAAGTSQNLGPTAYSDFYAASPWSLDGRWLAVSDASGNLRIVSAADGTPTVTGLALDGVPVVNGPVIKWSPTADVLAVRTTAGLTTVDVTGTNRVDLRVMPSATTWDFAWSPDGTRIVVAEDRGSSGGVQVDNLDASGRGAALSVATLSGSGQQDLCLRWDAPTNR